MPEVWSQRAGQARSPGQLHRATSSARRLAVRSVESWPANHRSLSARMPGQGQAPGRCRVRHLLENSGKRVLRSKVEGDGDRAGFGCSASDRHRPKVPQSPRESSPRCRSWPGGGSSGGRSTVLDASGRVAVAAVAAEAACAAATACRRSPTLSGSGRPAPKVSDPRRPAGQVRLLMVLFRFEEQTGPALRPGKRTSVFAVQCDPNE